MENLGGLEEGLNLSAWRRGCGDWSFRGGLNCLMRRPRIQALASVYFLAGARFGDCVKSLVGLCGCGGLSGRVWLHEWLPPCGAMWGLWRFGNPAASLFS